MDKIKSNPTDATWPAWLTKEQASARLGKPVSVLQHLQYRGYLHPVLRSGIRLYALAEVEALARPGRRPSPWIASPPRARATHAKTAKTATRRTEGQEAAHVFRLLDQGLSLREIVMQAGVPPHRVRSLHREWTRSLEQGPPPDDHALGDGAELDALAVVAEDLFAREG
jgi:hypothetical protein